MSGQSSVLAAGVLIFFMAVVANAQVRGQRDVFSTVANNSSSGSPVKVSLYLSDKDSRNFSKSIAEVRRLQRLGVNVSGIYLFRVKPRQSSFRGEKIVPSEKDQKKAFEQILSQDTQKMGGLARKILTSMNRERPQADDKQIKDSGFEQDAPLRVADVIRETGSDTLPFWVVSTERRDYVFPGRSDLLRVIDDNGSFTGERGDAASVRKRLPPLVKSTASGEKIADLIAEIEDRKLSSGRDKGIGGRRRNYYFSAYYNPAGVQQEEARLEMKLPLCSSSRVRRNPIRSITQGLSNIDVVLYDPASPRDRSEATKWEGKIAPYPNGQSFTAGEVNDLDPFLLLTLGADVQCLPTRYRYLVEGDTTFVEYREGINAWDK
ncbi:MAG: hypothetical protein PHC51_08885 [bacterium]|nr:hypothetical protein [bacterium]